MFGTIGQMAPIVQWEFQMVMVLWPKIFYYFYLYLLHLYPGFYSYTEGANPEDSRSFNGDPPHLTLNQGFPGKCP